VVDSCPRKGRWFGGCRFEPRYHVDEPTRELRDIIMRQWAASPADKDLLTIRMTYVHDVCVRCGKIVGGDGDEDAATHDDCADCDRMDCRERGCIASVR
jgi:hypothetical protein